MIYELCKIETNKVTSDWFILELSTGQFQLEIATGRIGDETLNNQRSTYLRKLGHLCDDLQLDD